MTSKTKDDDPKQSEAFRKAVRDLEAAGALDHAKGDAVLDLLLRPKKADTAPAKE